MSSAQNIRMLEVVAQALGPEPNSPAYSAPGPYKSV